MRRAAAILIATTLLAASCGDDDGEEPPTDTAAATTTAVPVDEALAAFCDETEQYLALLDGLGGALEDSTLTVGSLTASQEALGPARDAVVAAGDELQTAVEAAAAAAEQAAAEQLEAEGSTTTTTEPLVQVTEESIDRLVAADEEFVDTVEGIDADTPLADATVEVTSAAYQLEVAWLLVYAEAGCLADPEGALDAVTGYVAALQTDLETAGYYTGAIDGLFGPATVDAVKALQAANGLPETGLPDRATQDALATEIGDAESAQVAALQGLLTLAGYYTGPIDGIPSAELDAAVGALQADYGLEPTGVVGPNELHAVRLAIAGTVAEPPTESTTTQSTEGDEAGEPTIAELLAARDDMTSLVSAIDEAGLGDVLAGEDEITVFAPTDDAFEALPDGTLEALRADPDALTEVLTYHVAEGALTAEQVVALPTITTVQGDDLTVTVDDEGTVTINGTAAIVEADLLAANGVVHVIDAVLTPPET